MIRRLAVIVVLTGVLGGVGVAAAIAEPLASSVGERMEQRACERTSYREAGCPFEVDNPMHYFQLLPWPGRIAVLVVIVGAVALGARKKGGTGSDTEAVAPTQSAPGT